ncbi:MAG: Rpn family recombination-promoting nuclease/putative transposase [Gammaproteobacteria bacterium]|nr:Rpn family recombination-promoting nuclease/putative transposase [Gammaproteobacteria bacterium]
MTAAVSHDAFFKRFLNDPSIAKDFLNIHLPASVKKRCNFRTLKIESGSYVEEGLKQHYSDILYSMKISKKKGYIYCLIEHQSTPDSLMPFRMLRYQISIMKQYLDKGHKKLPIVLPLLFYHGKIKPYPYSIDIHDCFEEATLARELMFKPLHLIDITAISDDEIKTHKTVALLEMVQKHIFERNIINLAHEIAYLAKLNVIGHEMFKDVILYVLRSGEEDDYEAFFKIITSEAEEYKEDVMTMADRIMEKGVQQGIQQGIQKGEYVKAIDIAKKLCDEGFDMFLIKKLTGLSDEDLKLLYKH